MTTIPGLPYEQLETFPETIEQELRPAVCEHRQTDLRRVIVGPIDDDAKQNQINSDEKMADKMVPKQVVLYHGQCMNKTKYAFDELILLNNVLLTRVTKYKYLGHCISDDLSDDDDMARQYRQIYAPYEFFYVY